MQYYKCRDIIRVRWKMFTFCATNLLRIVLTKFYQNRMCFVEDITKTFWRVLNFFRFSMYRVGQKVSLY